MQKATRQDTRAHNAQLIFRAIYGQDEISRADLARVTGLTRTTVSDVVSELLRDGLVAEVGLGKSVGGKPPILLSVVEDSRVLLGVDLANSEFRGALINLRGQICHRASLPVRDRDGDAALNLVLELIQSLLSAATRPIAGIGIGTPGLMDPHKRIVRHAVNLDWRDLPLGDVLEQRFGLPVYIANDSQVAALGEQVFGEGRGAANLIVIKAGRGIGAGIILGGQLYYGDGFGAGEIGHVAVVEQGELCRCGNRGCLETVASSRAVVNQARLLARQDPGSIYNRLVSSHELIDTEVVLRALESGDEGTRAIIDRAGAYLGIAVAYLVGTLNVHRIVLAGSLARFGPALLEPVRRELRRRALGALTADTVVHLSNLGTDIVALGAAAQVLSNELGLM